MKLIDADALMRKFKTISPMAIDGRARQIVEDMPTIEDRKTGKWIPMEVSSGRDSWKCSICGRRARGKLKNLPYCHCGAKMEVEHE